MPILPDIDAEVELNKGRVKLFKGRLADFRQMTSRKSDVMKMLGAGNVAGLIALATFLTGSERKNAMAFGGAVLVAKLCFFIFGVGTALFGRAFWLLYQFENDLDGNPKHLPCDHRQPPDTFKSRLGARFCLTGVRQMPHRDRAENEKTAEVIPRRFSNLLDASAEQCWRAAQI